MGLSWSWDLPWVKILLSLSVFAVGFLFDDVMTGVAMYRARNLLQNPSSNPPLPDMGFDLIPDLNALCQQSQIESYFLLAVMIYTLVRMMIFQDGGVGIFCRFAVVDGILMMMRGTTIAITSLNNPWPACFQCGIDGGCPQSLFECVSYTVQRFPFYDCGDLIFSGHTVHFLMVGLVWATYAKTTFKKAESTLVWLAIVVGIAMLVSCRFHYSIDVLIGFYFTVMIWFIWNYLSLVRAPLLSNAVRYLEPQAGEVDKL